MLLLALLSKIWLQITTNLLFFLPDFFTELLRFSRGVDLPSTSDLKLEMELLQKVVLIFQIFTNMMTPQWLPNDQWHHKIHTGYSILIDSTHLISFFYCFFILVLLSLYRNSVKRVKVSALLRWVCTFYFTVLLLYQHNTIELLIHNVYM